MTFPADSVVVTLDQRLSKVAIHWLEPEAPDSAMRWGFFDSIFEQREYGEAYVLEKLARENMAKDPALKAEFERRVQTDPRFAADPEARLEFFYDRSPYGLANHVGRISGGQPALARRYPSAVMAQTGECQRIYNARDGRRN